MARQKAKTNTQMKQRYKNKVYKRYQVYLRQDEDYKIIEWIESHKDLLGTTNLFREALECYINQEDSDWF